jgi:hypothetical protein
MAYGDYGEGRGGPGGYEDRDRGPREGGRGWMDRAREYFDRAREEARDLYAREQAPPDRYERSGPAYPGGRDLYRSDRGDYNRPPYDRGYGEAGRGRAPGGGYEGGYGGSSVREGGPEGGYGGGRRGGSMGGNSYTVPPRPDLGDRNPSQGFTGGYGGGYGPTYASSGGGFGETDGFGHAQHPGRPSYAGRGSKNYRRSDARIEEEVHEALMRHHEIDATDIDVHVQNGEVTLTGEVEDRRAKRLAEEIVEHCPGVRDVHNELRARRGLFGAIADAATGSADHTRSARDRVESSGAARDPAAGGSPSARAGSPGGSTDSGAR